MRASLLDTLRQGNSNTWRNCVMHAAMCNSTGQHVEETRRRNLKHEWRSFRQAAASGCIELLQPFLDQNRCCASEPDEQVLWHPPTGFKGHLRRSTLAGPAYKFCFASLARLLFTQPVLCFAVRPEAAARLCCEL